MNKSILFIGNGWGAISAYKSLTKTFGVVDLISTDDDVASLLTGEMFDESELMSMSNRTIVVSGYKPLIPKKVTDNNVCINVHYSLLPKYRGLHSTVWAVINDEEYIGLTIHLMNEYMDDGPIIHQKAFRNNHKDTARDFMVQNNKYVEEHLGEIIDGYLQGNIILKPNDKSKATWVGKRNKADCKIDFSRPISYQKAFFRALVSPYPVPYIEYKGCKYYVTSVDFHKENVDTQLGRILNIDNEGVWIKILDGYIILKSMIDEEGKNIPSNFFHIGSRLDGSVNCSSII